MATRSRIGMEMPNGEVRSIYCHWDGYAHREILTGFYMNPQKVEALIELGDISILGESLIPLGDISILGTHGAINIPGVTHTFDNPAPGVTVAYHRDRGEDYNPARVDMNIESFAKSDFEEYGYVFTQQGEWITFV